jgi:hypothetical protein
MGVIGYEIDSKTEGCLQSLMKKRLIAFLFLSHFAFWQLLVLTHFSLIITQ